MKWCCLASGTLTVYASTDYPYSIADALSQQSTWRARRVYKNRLPSESDCLFLENPPPVPALKPYVYYPRGRPKKGTAPPSVVAALFEVGSHTVPREDLPEGVPVRGLTDQG